MLEMVNAILSRCIFHVLLPQLLLGLHKVGEYINIEMRGAPTSRSVS
jgi:hypothetical protein